MSSQSRNRKTLFQVLGVASIFVSFTAVYCLFIRDVSTNYQQPINETKPYLDLKQSSTTEKILNKTNIPIISSDVPDIAELARKSLLLLKDDKNDTSEYEYSDSDYET